MIFVIFFCGERYVKRLTLTRNVDGRPELATTKLCPPPLTPTPPLPRARLSVMVRKLKHHEQKLLKKVDFLAVRTETPSSSSR